MSTANETAVQALVSALRAAALADGAALPEPARNAGLLVEMDAAIAEGAYLNVLDGEVDPKSRVDLVGAGPEVEYELVVELEWLVVHRDQAERDAAFDRGVAALREVLLADRTLGGAADWVDAGPLTNREEAAVAGEPAMKAATIPVRILLTASTALG